MRLKIALLIILFPTLSSAQETKTVNVEKIRFNLLEEMSLNDQFLDSAFIAGRVKFKNGATTNAYLNYNLVANGIYFTNDQKQALMLDGLPDIQLINYGKRTFLPINKNEVVEVVETYKNGTSLLLHRKAQVKNTSKYRGPYGTSTETASIDRISKVYDINTFTSIDEEVSVDITLSSYYIIMKNGKRYYINGIRDVKKLYPEKWNDLKKYIKDNNLSMKTKDEIISIVKFCNN